LLNSVIGLHCSKVLESQAHGYVKAVQWILHYYYNGVQSWSW